MKIEKVNDNQIRCTLTREDLDTRQLKLSELAYGTEKAKLLFRDMMQQASYEFGFEAEDIPLMIEAIPLSADTIILIITKVEYPEELDTRFSKFSDSDMDSSDFGDGFSNDSDSIPEGADDILDLFKKIQQDKAKSAKAEQEFQKTADFVPLDEALASHHNAKKSSAAKPSRNTDSSKTAEPVVVVNMTKLFIFHQFNELTHLAKVLKGFYNETNSVFKSPSSGNYYLIINKGNHTPEDFNKVCNILSEYASQSQFTASSEAYFTEHYTTLVENNALQVLADL